MSDKTANPLGSEAFRSALAELLGTFFLALAALTVAPPLTPFAVGLTLLVFVYAVGSLSGAHLNPAVTVGLVVSRRFPLAHGLLYVVAQVAGALLARAVARAGLVGELGHSYQAGTIAAEFVGFGILMLTVAATTEKQVAKAGSGIAVGGALLAGLLVSHGVLNPAVALAMGLAASPAVWATLLSAVGFSLVFSVIERTKPAEVEADSAPTPKARADDSN
ncbi:aquaporin [Hymenobacter sp. H14-R3]|uniref:aquaporin n=1 Tax=Hymenobacter sp. H14-R3 TaxID=3046308 RepID=UPI0024BA17E3|nr:aquaporin [Hymenobacter sp. H14-R3]MDJ0366719.1 aquaporin [Hymenobacter sp. H14-R3]